MKDYIYFYYDEIKRFSPVLLLIYTLYYVKEEIYKRFLFFGYIINIILNFILKNYVFSPLMKDNYYPIIGYGMRPENAKNCDLWSTGKIATSYGMPSGHAQIITFFLISQLFKSNGLSLSRSTTILSYNNLLWIFITLMLLYSRIELGCHTYQQVVIGIVFGILSYFITQKIVKITTPK